MRMGRRNFLFLLLEESRFFFIKYIWLETCSSIPLGFRSFPCCPLIPTAAWEYAFSIHLSTLAWRTLQKMTVLEYVSVDWPWKHVEWVSCVITGNSLHPWIHLRNTHQYQGGPWGRVGHKSERWKKILSFFNATWPSHQISHLPWQQTYYFPTSWKDEGNGFLVMECKIYSEIQNGSH